MLRVELKCSRSATGGGLSADSIMGLARLLIEAGHPDQPLECWRGEMKCLTFPSLFWAAGHTMREEPALRVETYRKFSGINKLALRARDIGGNEPESTERKMP